MKKVLLALLLSLSLAVNSQTILSSEAEILFIIYLANNSFKSLTSSSAVHWSERLVKPQISANNILNTNKIVSQIYII